MKYEAKAHIDKIGSFDDDGNPVNWWFSACQMGLQILPDGSCLYGGYTIEELRRIKERQQ